MKYTLVAADKATANYLRHELGNLKESMPVTVETDGCTVTSGCDEEFGRYFTDEVKSILCRWFDYRAKAAYLKERLPNPGLDVAIYEAYLQGLALLQENYDVQENLPLNLSEVDVEALYRRYTEEIRGEWDKIVATAADYSIPDNGMAIRFIRKLRRDIHPQMSYLKLTAADDGYVFTDYAGCRLDFLRADPPFGMVTDSIWLNSGIVEIESKLTRRLPLLDLVRDVNPDLIEIPLPTDDE